MTAPPMIRSGWCGAGWHGRCVGSYSGCACDCDCHSAVEPEQPLRIGSLFSGYEGLGMAVQDVLGEHQDACVAEAHIRSLLGRPHGQRWALAAGRLIERQAIRREWACAAFGPAWARLEHQGRAVWLA